MVHRDTATERKGNGMPAVGWGAILQGEPTDLDDWVYVLKQGSDPWVEVHAGETILRSASLDALKSEDEVRARAEVIIERLNGAVALSQGADPVRFHGVVEFAPDGGRRRIFFGEAHARARAKARAEGMAIGPDGQPIPTPPQPTEVQSWAEIAENDPLLEDALIYFGRATDWFDFYKSLECLILRFGGKKNGEAKFLALGWAPE